MKKLYKVRREAVVGGVCIGFAKYFGIDPTVVRIGYAVFSLLTSIIPGIILYIICMIVMPDEDNTIDM